MTTKSVTSINEKTSKSVDETSSNPEMSQTSTNEVGVEKEISINEFLDFLNISCHLNDMINNNSSSRISSTNINQNQGIATKGSKRSLLPTQQQQQQHQHQHNRDPSSYVGSSNNSSNNNNYRTRIEVDFKKLCNNPLINELYGFEKIKQQRQLEQEQQQQRIVLDDLDKTKIRSRRSSTLLEDCMTRTQSQSFKGNVPIAGLHPKLSEKLDYVINEGILDAVLPYICPVPIGANCTSGRSTKTNKQNNNSTNNVNCNKDLKNMALPTTATETTTAQTSDSGSNNAETINKNINCTTSNINSLTRRKSVGSLRCQTQTSHKDSEVIIHVVDEVKNTAKDFTCPQALLIQKMSYFADVTAGQKLDDMDISVHCDIQIFDWLMRWIKHCDNMEHVHNTTVDVPPQLEASNVVPILVSASFLQMEPLLLDCLSYCHAHLSEVVRMSSNLSCLNDTIITRLAAMFTNLELEAVRDKKERVTPRLWTKLISSLCEPEPEALRGHFFSLSGLFRCIKCGKCLTNTIKSYINCVPNNIRLNRWGQLVSHHVRDSNWDMNQYIIQLFRELKSWRRVYWKLWGHCHFLYCCVCEAHFPVYQMSWCRYHPENAIYLGAQVEGRLSGPTGRYPCCSQQAFRYDPMPGPNGCQFREHSVLVATDRERAILSIRQVAAEDHMLCECPPASMREAVSSNEQEPRWLGLCLTPPNGRPGLLPPFNPEESMSRIARRLRGGASFFADSSTDSDTTDSLKESRQRNYATGGNSSSSDGCESECVTTSKFSHVKKLKKRTGRPPNIPGRHWSGDLSARSNQDHQREFEEKVIKQVVALVNKKNGFEQKVTTQTPMPLGGSFIRLEAEWREQLKQRHANNNVIGPAGSNNYIPCYNNNLNNTSNISGYYSSGAKKRLPTIPSSNF